MKDKASDRNELIARLSRVLLHEVRMGFVDRAVYGGLEKFVAAWASEAAPFLGSTMLSGLPQDAVEALRSYSTKDAEQRERGVRSLLGRLGGVENGNDQGGRAPRAKIEHRGVGEDPLLDGAGRKTSVSTQNSSAQAPPSPGLRPTSPRGRGEAPPRPSGGQGRPPRGPGRAGAASDPPLPLREGRGEGATRRGVGQSPHAG
ncbi:MAG: hypothetical protein M1358_21200, partial [Chloroflexi bacterium]|nr:hypothetical protein [Chloroflexota bacterium]